MCLVNHAHVWRTHLRAYWWTTQHQLIVSVTDFISVPIQAEGPEVYQWSQSEDEWAKSLAMLYSNKHVCVDYSRKVEDEIILHYCDLKS